MDYNNLTTWLNLLKQQKLIDYVPTITPYTKNIGIVCPLKPYTHDSSSFGRSSKKSLSIKVDSTGKSVCKCFHNECGFSGTMASLIYRLSEFNPLVNKPYLLEQLNALEDSSPLAFFQSLIRTPYERVDSDFREEFDAFQPVRKNYRGISLDSLLKFDVRIDFDKERIVVPLIKDNKIVGATGRAYRDHPLRWYNYWNYPKEAYLLGQHLTSKPQCILCEGSFDTIKVYDALHKDYDVYGILGSALSYEQSKYIKDNHDTVILFFDNDIAGRNATIKAAYMLEDMDIRVIIYHQFKKDPGDMDLCEIVSHVKNNKKVNIIS